MRLLHDALRPAVARRLHTYLSGDADSDQAIFYAQGNVDKVIHLQLEYGHHVIRDISPEKIEEHPNSSCHVHAGAAGNNVYSKPLISELGTKLEKSTRLIDTEGQFAGEQLSSMSN